MNKIDILILLAIGVTAHDVASIIGMHIPGVHAIYFSIPMIGLLLGMKLKKRLGRHSND